MSSSAVASKSASIPSNKKRKECDTTSVKVEDKKSYEELEIDLVERDKKIVSWSK
jgi:hypothetical protein